MYNLATTKSNSKQENNNNKNKTNIYQYIEELEL